jgi:hypothetical protein
MRAAGHYGPGGEDIVSRRVLSQESISIPKNNLALSRTSPPRCTDTQPVDERRTKAEPIHNAMQQLVGVSPTDISRRLAYPDIRRMTGLLILMLSHLKGFGNPFAVTADCNHTL